MYTPTIGLEVHAELKTTSKMFCGCENNPHAAEPNTLICPICLAHPGTLPVPNQAAIRSVLLFGTAVNGELATYSEFDRKNYFYPDIPKAYQLSQYAFPFVRGGELAGVALTRVHLEEDTARSQHDKGASSLVDYNRAGVPLMELVTEPVIHDATTAVKFAKELQLLLRTLGVSDANMEKGEMRVEANISVSDSEHFGTKVEVKNLNSFRSVEGAIEYEIQRQIAELEAGRPLVQETRGWDEVKNVTFSQRAKETAKDYRYFPDPDIPKLRVEEVAELKQSRLSEIMPELPAEKRLKYSNLGLTSDTIEVIMQSSFLTEYTDQIIATSNDARVVVLAVNYLVTDLKPIVDAAVGNEPTVITANHFVALMTLVLDRKVTSRVAKDLIIEFALNDTDLVAVATERNLLSSFDEGALQNLVATVIANHPTVVAEYKAGKTAALQFLLGQMMKETRGAADPTTLKTLLESSLQ